MSVESKRETFQRTAASMPTARKEHRAVFCFTVGGRRSRPRRVSRSPLARANSFARERASPTRSRRNPDQRFDSWRTGIRRCDFISTGRPRALGAAVHRCLREGMHALADAPAGAESGGEAERQQCARPSPHLTHRPFRLGSRGSSRDVGNAKGPGGILWIEAMSVPVGCSQLRPLRIPRRSYFPAMVTAARIPLG